VWIGDMEGTLGSLGAKPGSLGNKILDADHGVKGGFRRRVAVETLDAMVPSKQGLPSDPGRTADLSRSEPRTHTSSAAEVAVFDGLELDNCPRCPRSVHRGREEQAARASHGPKRRASRGLFPPPERGRN